MILDFDSKIKDFFGYVQTANEGERLIVKIKSQASEAETYDDFAKLYRRYRALNRRTVGDYFFKEMDDLVDKLCDDFEAAICLDN
jgi:type I restriction enzyme R subunit